MSGRLRSSHGDSWAAAHVDQRAEATRAAASASASAVAPRHGRARRPHPTARFAFDGRRSPGHAGDTLASALLANGVRLVGRSFKYHRPRGILSAGLRGAQRAGRAAHRRPARAQHPRHHGRAVRRARGQPARTAGRRWRSTCWRSTASRRRCCGAGFYYKTFMWPASFWEKVYEPLIRRAAGLGPRTGKTDPDTYEKALGLLRRAGHRRRAGRPDGGAGRRPRRRAGRPVRRGFPARRPAACPTAARSTASRRPSGRRSDRGELAACPTSR